jgi:hypothetical protein
MGPEMAPHTANVRLARQLNRYDNAGNATSEGRHVARSSLVAR